MLSLKVRIHKEKEGYWAEVLDLPGVYSQGDTLSEVKENIKDAIDTWFESELKEFLAKNLKQSRAKSPRRRKAPTDREIIIRRPFSLSYAA